MSDVAVDVVIVGGGPAGLSAALALGRALKKVLLCDAGTRRNAAAEHMHGFVTRDGLPPSEFRRIAREQLRPYEVLVRDVGVEGVTREADGGFLVGLADGTRARCRRVLLAVGLVDELPAFEGLRDLWGHSVFACPYCHGWEVRGRRWGLLAPDEAALEHAIFLTGWTKDVVAFTNGPLEASPALTARLERAGVVIEPRAIERLVAGPDRRLVGVAVDGGGVVARDVMVVRPPQRPIALVQQLGLALDGKGLIQVGEDGETSIPGIHAAGDAADPMQAAVLAAAAGTRAAYLMNRRMNLERFA